MSDDQIAKILETQNKLINLLLKQSPEPSIPGDLSKQSIQFDAFNPKDEKFDCYLLRLENFFAIKNLTGNSTKVDMAKTQILINSIGAKYIQLLRNATAPDDPREKKYEELIDILKPQLAPITNIFSEQHKFLSRTQKQGESISTYVSALQELALTCDWICPEPTCQKPFTPIILRAQLIRGLGDADVRERLLQSTGQAQISFRALVESAQSIELSKSENKEIYTSLSNPFPVNKLHTQEFKFKGANKFQNTDRRPNRPSNRNSTPDRYQSQFKPRTKVDFKALGIDGHCLRCGYTNHQVKDCRHQPDKFKCNSCGRIGHVDKVCVSTLLKNKSADQKSNSANNSVQYLAYDSDDDSDCAQLIR